MTTNQPPVEDARADAWDEGYRRACRDHSALCSREDQDHGQRHINPYRAASVAVPSDHTATTEDALRDLDEGTVIVDATGEVLHYIDSGEALIWSDVWTNECHVSLPARVLFVPGDEVPR